MTVQEAEKNPNVITSSLLLTDFPAYTLFDSRTTHSFVSSSFVAKSSIACDKSKSIKKFIIPSGMVLNTDKIARSVQVECKERTFEANLFIIDMKDFDYFSMD